MRYQAVPLALVCFGLCQAQDRQQTQFKRFSSEKEAVLGAALAAQVRRQTTPLGLISVNSYVDNLGRQLATQLPNTLENWQFSVIRDHETGSTYEPLSLPGGWVFVPAQLILAADGEAEFAGMLAHAMAHVAERQAIHQTPGDVNYFASIPLVSIGGPAGFGGDIENRLVPVGYLKIQRQYELEADQVAVAAMAAAGFDPNALLNYIARVQPEHSKGSQELSPLPPLSARISNLEHAIQSSSAPSSRSPDESFRAIQDEVRHEQTRTSTPKEVYRVPSLVHPSNR